MPAALVDYALPPEFPRLRRGLAGLAGAGECSRRRQDCRPGDRSRGLRRSLEPGAATSQRLLRARHSTRTAPRTLTPAHLQRIRALASDKNVRAIGEIGLDYYWDKTPRRAQIRAFEAQLDLAADLALPVILHNRESTADVLAALEAWTPTLPQDLRQRPGVMHSFSGGLEDAERALAAGFYLGFTGPITFKNAAEMRAVARATPPDRLLIETDAPFLAPHPKRGKRNEPALLPLVNAKLAQIHGIAADEMAKITSDSAERLFAFDVPMESPAADAGKCAPM